MVILLCGLQSSADADSRTRIIGELGQDPKMTLKKFTSSSRRLVILRSRQYLRHRRVFSCPAPYGSPPLVSQKLNCVQESGVLKHISNSAWASLTVDIEKPIKIVRICPESSTGSNVSLDMQWYSHPTPDNVFVKVNGGKHFAADALLRIEVEYCTKDPPIIDIHRSPF
ncbi:uncharacterized protein DEA37_0011290 [Paragonimus westermani]|uniref:Uncharacterized protein n=1 Tax=Paragonimus westermani TaxID=34504 RepID=A0A5J4NZJ7_9TREM|nr:uncharacterized protein DEA37_0011290 [Paragonimus westermani]